MGSRGTREMPEPLLAGVQVVDHAGPAAAMAGRILADLGADVALIEPPGGHGLRAQPYRWRAWSAAKRPLAVTGRDDPALDSALAAADIVIDTPADPDDLRLDPSRAPRAVWVSVTPFGLDGPRAHWRADDLGVMAASGNLFCTGDRDRPPVRGSQPIAIAHTGPEVALAAISALWSGGPRRVDVSMQEVVLIANMGTPGAFPETGFRGTRRGANIGRTREIWPCADGWVSFGLRGGKARVPSLETLTRLVAADGVDGAETLNERDWTTFSHTAATGDDLAAIEAPVAAYFARHTMRQLYAIACETNLMLAPVNSPSEILASEQLAARGFFEPRDGIERFPRSFATINVGSPPDRTEAPMAPPVIHRDGSGAWAGVRILEFGSGAAGPIASRYFVENGATVLRVESRSRPDFLRVYALGPDNPHGLDGAPMFDALNVAKLSVGLNLKHPEALQLAARLATEWADAVTENFAPRAMRGFGLDYESLVARRADLVMASACLNGQTGPHKDYPGFGGQGSALSGYNFVTGWPDREPVGPHGTITDSLAPRFVATALAAALWHRRQTGRGAHIDVSQVEAAVFTLSPWLLAYQIDGVVGGRCGDRDPDGAVPHGVFACADEGGVGDRWVAIACRDDEDRASLAPIIGANLSAENPDAAEAALNEFTRHRTRAEVAERLQAAGVEAVPVQDFGDLHADPQLAHRGHFVSLPHPVMGLRHYERNGFRVSGAPGGYPRSGPTLGQDTDSVLTDILGLDDATIARLTAEGALD